MFVRETKPQIEEQYIKTGKVYFVHRDFPLTDVHPGALLAAHVANCAAAQNGFWPMHDQLFAGQVAGEWNNSRQSDVNRFLEYTQSLGLDVAEMTRCISDNRYASQIEADFREAAEKGVRSTPSFLVNGTLIVGAYPFSAWQEILDKQLAQQ